MLVSCSHNAKKQSSDDRKNVSSVTRSFPIQSLLWCHFEIMFYLIDTALAIGHVIDAMWCSVPLMANAGSDEKVHCRPEASAIKVW